ncbi:hypothetical protein BN77_p11395 [Rhizobium mesoamericanum STM3625]|uniref:Uncharacterized protein n=1 Tax=Rhizobium mesoamericanum STM3625 TaxID=1211777 RepID=K0Q2G9_9HYPH|nr:hypothetical protein BN77_p11395 [Rhizobium mesoamericanum STM3625]
MLQSPAPQRRVRQARMLPKQRGRLVMALITPTLRCGQRALVDSATIVPVVTNMFECGSKLSTLAPENLDYLVSPHFIVLDAHTGLDQGR